ncbi:hypothetical protein ACKZDW_01500 (plasmid) [Ralstonia syzygii subsp. celebesensis]
MEQLVEHGGFKRGHCDRLRKKEQVRIVMATRSDRQNAPATPANRPRETDTVIVASPACAIPDSVAETTRESAIQLL